MHAATNSQIRSSQTVYLKLITIIYGTTNTMCSTLRGFDPVYTTLRVGPDRTKLMVPDSVLLKIPSVGKIVSKEAISRHEPVVVETYDPQVFATVLALVRDGFKDFKPLRTSHEFIKAYLLAFDLGLEQIQNFLIDKIRAFHLFAPVEPLDLLLLYPTEHSHNKKIHALLLHRMAHHFCSKTYRSGEVGEGTNLDPRYAEQLGRLRRSDLVQLAHHVTLASAVWECTGCHDSCYYHSHNHTPPCVTSGAKTQHSTSPKPIPVSMQKVSLTKYPETTFPEDSSLLTPQCVMPHRSTNHSSEDTQQVKVNLDVPQDNLQISAGCAVVSPLIPSTGVNAHQQQSSATISGTVSTKTTVKVLATATVQVEQRSCTGGSLHTTIAK